MKILLGLALGAALAATFGFRSSRAVTHWEYQVYAPSNTDADINSRGAEGWELVQYVNGAWIFKRPAP